MKGRRNEMRVGVYIRQLTTLGGGNRYALAAAEHLSHHHQVDILTHTPLGASAITSRLTLDMSRVKLRFVPAQPAAQLAPLTQEYDLFVNALHNYYVPCQARHGALIIFFPPQSRLDTAARIRRTIAKMLNGWLAVELASTGMYEPEYEHGRTVRLLTGCAEMQIAPSLRPIQATFDLSNPSSREQTIEVSLGDRSLQKVSLPPDAVHSCQIDLPGWQVTPYRLQFGIGSEQTPPLESVSAGPQRLPHMRLADFRVNHPRALIYRQLFERLLPGWRDRLLHVPPERFLGQVDTYDTIWAISLFTQRWIDAYWNRPSELVYPMVEVEAFRPAAKRQAILSVGRFFVAAHNKKHLLMIQAFKEMVDGGLADWTLHLAGGVVDDPIHRRYLESVREAAQGYPIQIHANLPFTELVDLYAQSAIYWHAAGFGEDEEREPIKLEHFGVTTVEAMASGCVPVVIRKGGQTEIIEHGRTGFLWTRVEELKEYTLRLIQNEPLRQEMAGNALIDSKRFDRTHFGAAIDRSLQRIGAEV
ncbi:MAG: glycosyltransferase [Chloroflexi bacterium]|nr:glycosyltransferase [Chloroflexota bacterium]